MLDLPFSSLLGFKVQDSFFKFPFLKIKPELKKRAEQILESAPLN
jgi:hypothetical protein